MSSFDQLNLSSAMVKNLKRLGYETPTPVQSASIPPILSGQDVIAMAKTGSGKTAAFGIGLIEQLNVRHFAVQGLVLCPTRELADQVAKALRELARGRQNIKVVTLCGGVGIGPQIGSLSHGAHLVVGTPGRVQDHLRKGTLVLDHLRALVLDEADRMLDMGFQDSIDDIIAKLPETRQTLLFSATWPGSIRSLSHSYQHNPIDIRVTDDEPAPDIEQTFYEIQPGQQADTLAAILSERQPASCLAFCSTRQQCDELAATLSHRGFSAAALHGDLDQKERDAVLVRFSNQSVTVLVATDVAARGLDIKSLPLVVNVEPARDSEIHTHRVGRTGRAGEQGQAITLCTPAQGHRVSRLEKKYESALSWGNIETLLTVADQPVRPPMRTLCVAGGRKDKVRPGDLLGALTGEAGIPGDAVGKIDLSDYQCFVAVKAELAGKALQRLEAGRIKGRKFRVRMV
ncbi:MAG: ATP-dependent RNA helicase DbpA [Oleiphilaceae bacterium]|nr:ATP-dependent RNA helicase DbpA [Oleiphilaceae bacterium]